MMLSNQITNNCVNEARTNNGEGLSHGRCPVEEQRRPGRHQATARTGIRKKWSREENMFVMECYYRSVPSRRGYRKRMLDLWREKSMFIVTEQRLVDQSNQIRKRGWLTDLELEEIIRRIEYGNVQHEREENREQPRSNDTGTDIEIDIVYSQDQESSFNLQSENDSDAQRANGSDNNIRQTLCMISGASLTDEEKAQINRLNEILNEGRKSLPSMRAVGKNKLNIEVQRINKLLQNIQIDDLTKMNELIYAGAVFIAEKFNMFEEKTKKSKPAWELRLEQQIKQLKQDYSRMKALNENKAVKRKHVDRLERKYRFDQKGKSTVLETIRQRMIAKEGKMKRYRNRINQYNQNRTFQNNEGRFCQQLSGQIGGKEQEKPNAEVTVTPIVIGALGTVPKSLKNRLDQIGIRTKIETMQTTALLNTARIVRKVLEL